LNCEGSRAFPTAGGDSDAYAQDASAEYHTLWFLSSADQSPESAARYDCEEEHSIGVDWRNDWVRASES